MFKRVVLWVLPVILTAALVVSMFYGPFFGLGAKQRDVRRQLDKLNFTQELIQDHYVLPASSDKLFDGAMRGMVDSLDPFSEYFSAEEFQQFETDLKGKFGGLGVEIVMEDKFLTVISPWEGTPAMRAGMRPHDKIIEINGESAEGISIQAAMKKLRGDPGTEVELTVLHKGDKEPVKMRIMREIIRVKSVKGVRMADPELKIGYARITMFQENSGRELEAAVRGLMADGMRALIVDVRNNSGGILDEAIAMCDLFLASGVIVSTQGRADGESSKSMAKAEGTVPDFPMVVLANEYSASASEVFAGAMQDHKRAIIVGARTYGKGSVQRPFVLTDGSCVKLTVAKYHTPSGRCIHKEPGKKEWGIQPDVPVEMKMEDIARLQQSWSEEGVAKPPEGQEEPPKNPEFVDVQLAKALEVLREKLNGPGK